MPELPEVETTRRGISPHVEGKRISRIEVRNAKLRWPVPLPALQGLSRCQVKGVSRRGKYLLFATAKGTVIVHLGMSGSLRIARSDEPPMAHDHVDMLFTDKTLLRYTDPRRFGTWLFTTEDPMKHELLRSLGPEPLEDAFDVDYLYQASRGRKVAVKQFIMNSHVVVGVGNIYANEALFLAGIDPKRAAGRIAKSRYQKLVPAIKTVLAKAIEQGGTTLRDFVGGDGQPGYFKQQLNVYGRGEKPCRVCKKPLTEIRMGQRTTVFCKFCQT
ncbi:MAG: bifunctional DNA-formamidopyrimidine glycosylase/DNA-(apurinic or apyrimidinic site) lyase, partial [Pseudomonadales bacterium]|nr:bifunctional DNA-formamidopyrimidine glycosylase/DNA-(apurinic or apyrimidinic site) lyase [Pseudomonadales bacterium]